MSVCQRFPLHSQSGNASRLPPERLMLDRQQSLAPVSCSLNINYVCSLPTTYYVRIRDFLSVLTPVCGVQGLLPGESPRKLWKESD
jgi:hypothetical protein